MNLPPQSPSSRSALPLCCAQNSCPRKPALTSSLLTVLTTALLSFFSVLVHTGQAQESSKPATPTNPANPANPQANFLEEVSPSPPAEPAEPAENEQQPSTNTNPPQAANQAANPAAANQKQAIKIEFDANSPLLEIPRPAALAREAGVVYLADILSPEARVLLETSMDTVVYDNAQASMVLDSLKAGAEVELLGFSQQGLLVRGQSATGQGFALGWIGKRAAADLQAELLAQFALMQQRQNLVAQLIEEKEVALGMTPDEVRHSLGRPDQETLRQTAAGLSGTYSWVETRQVPHYETLRDRYTGQLYRRIVGYDTIETSRTDVEFANGLVSAIQRSKDRRRNKDLPAQIAPPFLVTW